MLERGEDVKDGPMSGPPMRRWALLYLGFDQTNKRRRIGVWREAGKQNLGE